MPAEFLVDVSLQVVFTTGRGVIVVDDFGRHLESLSRHPDFRPEFRQIVDLREVTEFNLTSADLREFSKRNLFSPNARRAVLVASDLMFGLARMFETYRQMAGEEGIKVVTSMKEARRWVGLLDEDI